MATTDVPQITLGRADAAPLNTELQTPAFSDEGPTVATGDAAAEEPGSAAAITGLSASEESSSRETDATSNSSLADERLAVGHQSSSDQSNDDATADAEGATRGQVASSSGALENPTVNAVDYSPSSQAASTPLRFDTVSGESIAINVDQPIAFAAPAATPPTASNGADGAGFGASGGETVTLPGSGIVFVNTYGAGVNTAFHTAILAAENLYQSHFTNSVTLNMSFDLQSLGPKFSGQNQFFNTQQVSYTNLRAALAAHATSADDIAAVNTLSSLGDPTGGKGFLIASGLARILGFEGPANTLDDAIVLNSDLAWTYGQDAIGTLEHEISEGAMGRVGGLGVQNNNWGPLDLFRYSGAGKRDFTGGSDGLATFFSVDGVNLLTQFHNAIDANHVFDGQDPGDWGGTVGDAYGPGGPGSPGVVTATDLRVMDILGWTPTGSAPPPTDDFANSLSDATHPFGQAAINGFANGTLETAGDRDWFKVQLASGATYIISVLGQYNNNGTLADPYLRIHNAAGALVAENDDIQAGVIRDSQFTLTINVGGTFYIEAGAFDDGATGTYKVVISQNADDFANTLTDATHPFGQVAVNGSATGMLEVVGDRDWFRVQLTAGVAYTINLQGQHAGVGTLEDPYLLVHNSAGTLVGENDDIQDGVIRDSQLTFTPTATGTYYFEAGSFNDQYTGTYKISFTGGPPPPPTDDFANTLTDATHPLGQINVNGSHTGALEVTGDRDWFKVQLTAGRTYTISEQGQHAGAGTLEDPYLRLHDSTGAQVAFDDDIQDGVIRDSRLTFTPTATGAYYLEAGAFDDNYAGTYRLGVTTDVQDISDVDGDGTDDVLFQIHTSGQVLFAKMAAGAFVSWGADTGPVGGAATWHAVTSGDVNPGATGGAETFLQNGSNGSIIFASVDTGHTVYGVVSTSINTDFALIAAADINGDRSADVVVQQQSTGTIIYANMAGGTFHNWALVSGNINPDFKAVGAGDINGDGFADVIVQQQSTGSIIWANMAGGVFSGWGAVSQQLNPTWQVKAVADFNGDGFADVLIQRAADGLALYANMAHGAFSGWVTASQGIGPTWVVTGAADVDNDGLRDVILQHTTDGTTIYAHMGPNGLANYGVVTTTVSSDFHVV